MSCDVGKATEGWRMSCDVCEVMERLENQLCSSTYRPRLGSTYILTGHLVLNDLWFESRLRHIFLSLKIIIYMSSDKPVAVYDRCGSIAFVYWLRLKQYL